MLAKGFVPDVISSDVHALNIDGPVFDLMATLSKFYCLGLDLATLVRTATSAPAAALRRPDIGSLAVGSTGDATVFAIEDGEFDFTDALGEVLRGQHRLACRGIVSAAPGGTTDRTDELKGKTMSESNLVGGSKSDRKQVLDLHADYLDANARFDRDTLDPIWSSAPEALFFNLNGHTYKGRDHWFRLWQYYGQNVHSSYWTPFDIGGVVSDDMAVVWCHRRTKRNWTGRSRRRRTSITAATISSPARPWCSARKRASGASCTCIFPRRARRASRRRIGRAPPRAGGLFEGDVSDLPKLSVRPARRDRAGRCIALAKAAKPRALTRLVCGKSLQPRRVSGGVGMHPGHQPDHDRHRRVQSL